MGHIAEAEVESGRIFAQRLARSPYLKSWDASWPDSGRGIAELRSARKYGGLNQRYFGGTSPPIEPRCTAADCAEVGLGSLGRRLREHCSGKPLLATEYQTKVFTSAGGRGCLPEAPCGRVRWRWHPPLPGCGAGDDLDWLGAQPVPPLHSRGGATGALAPF